MDRNLKILSHIDRTDRGVVTGWAYSEDSPGERIKLDLLVDNNLVATFSADQFREDLLQANIGDGHHAFFQPFPEALFDEQEHKVDIRVSGTTFSLAKSSMVIRLSGKDVFEGRLETAHFPKIAGWAWNRHRPDKPVQVDIFLGDELHATVTSEDYRPDLKDAGKGDGRVGFHATLTGSLAHDDKHEISAHIFSTKMHLQDSPRLLSFSAVAAVAAPPRMSPEDYEGNLHPIRGGNVSGWARRLDDPDSIDIDIYVDGEHRDCVPANRFREDLVDLGKGCGFHEFVWNLPVDLKDGKEHLIAARAGSYELQKSPLSFVARTVIPQPADNVDPSYEGSFDRVQGHIVLGWVWDKHHPDERVDVGLYCDDEYIVSAQASRYRADLKKARMSDGYHAFAIEVPEHYFDGRPHRLNLRVVGADQELGNSPQTVQLGTTAIRHQSLTPEPSATEKFYTVPPALFYKAPLFNQPSEKQGKLPHISIVILNRNGQSVLEDLFASFATYNSYPNFDFIVVDHASEDRSLKTLHRWSSRLPLVTVARTTNDSFSCSNNRATQKAQGEYILFLNNDTIFSEDILGPMAALLDDMDTGIVGIKLLDVAKKNNRLMPPRVQHLGIMFGINRANNKLEAHDVHFTDETAPFLSSPVSMPATTGAALLVRKDEFLAIGGFHEAYFYELEDVDLGLKYKLLSGKNVVVANHLSLLHHRGHSRFKIDEAFKMRTRGNADVLSERFGLHMRREYLASLFNSTRQWTEKPLRVAFAVTEARMDSSAGDYFTAWELGEELQKQFGWEIYYLEEDENWYDLTDTDVLIVMRGDYDLNRIEHPKPNLMKIGWARNWFNQWTEREWFYQYDLCFCSSEKAMEHIKQNTAVRTRLLRIATNPARFQQAEKSLEFESDYCFTGSFFRHKRDFLMTLDPKNLPYRFALYGHNWGKFSKFHDNYRGSIPYPDIPLVYASTKVVLDDANHVSKEWGTTNSRVFDALGAGVLVVSNSQLSSEEVFGGQLPVYTNQANLESQLSEYLGDDKKRQELAETLQKEVLKKHTYAHRAQEVRQHMQSFFGGQHRISIKVGVPSRGEVEQWSDYPFALAMKRSFERLGLFVRIDILPEWTNKYSTFDDVVIVLRGPSKYEPQAGQINLMWNISHPDDVPDREYECYDHVFVASQLYAHKLSSRLKVPVSALLQCTDPKVFHKPDPTLHKKHEVLVVGNPRNTFRTTIKDAVEMDIPIEVYGARWEGFLPPHFIKGEHILNSELKRHYAGAAIVLDDHGDNMAHNGFISNRIFDAGASGAFIISSEVEGLQDVFGDAVVTYSTQDELRKHINHYLKNIDERQSKSRDLQDKISGKHTFDDRIVQMMKVIGDVYLIKYAQPHCRPLNADASSDAQHHEREQAAITKPGPLAQAGGPSAACNS